MILVILTTFAVLNLTVSFNATSRSQVIIIELNIKNINCYIK